MSDQNKLREILRNGIDSYVHGNGVDEAEQAILGWINEVIGEDERGCPEHKTPKPDCEDGVCRLTAYSNTQKMFQRKRAGL